MDIKLPVNPAENFRIIGICVAEGDSIGPVLRQAVLLGHGLKSGGADGDLHQDVRLLGARVVLPQGRQRLVRTAVTCKKIGDENYQNCKSVELEKLVIIEFKIYYFCFVRLLFHTFNCLYYTNVHLVI